MTPGADNLCVFAAKRGILKGRFDVQNLRYSFNLAEPKFKKVSLGNLTAEEPCYGTSATAIVRTGEDQPKYIRITDFDDFGIKSDHQYMTAEKYSTKHLLNEQDILFARTGGTVGKTYFYDGSIGPAIFAGYCIRFKFDNTKVLPKYVYWYTKTEEYADWVKGIQRPSGQPNINKEEYKSYEIVLPDRPLQEVLSARMDLAEKKREHMYQQADELLEGGKKYLLSVLDIVKPTYKSSLCCGVKLKDTIRGGTLGVEYYHPERIAVIYALRSNSNFELERLSDVVKFCRNTVDSGSCSEKYLGLAGVESQSGELSGIKEDASGQAFSYQAGDVLYGRLRPYLNKVLLAECSGICSTEFHVMRVLNPDKLLPEYLAAIMLSDLVVAQTKHMMTGNTHPRISNDDIKNLYIPIPNIEIQKSIAAELSIRKAEARKLRAAAEQEWQTAKAEFEKELLGE